LGPTGSSEQSQQSNVERSDGKNPESEGRANAISVVGERLSVLMPQGWVRVPVNGPDADRVVIFQIPNPADEGTPDSANALVTVAKWSDVKSGGDILAAAINKGPGGMIVSDLTSDDGRRVILARRQQDKTPYLEGDLIRPVNGLMVLCTMSYPLLAKSTEDWNAAMLRDFKVMASSVRVDGVQVFPGPDPTATGKGD
jgi:hypothetical protein